jgi:hypothetical protein
MRKNEHGLLAREDGEEEREGMRKRVKMGRRRERA